MGIRLVMEAATSAAPGLTWRERYVLTVLAASAIDATRECPAGLEDRPEIIARLRLSRTQRYAVLGALVAKGALLRLERGRNGVRAVYAIPSFTAETKRPGDPDAPAVDNPQGTEPVPVDNPAKSPAHRDATGCVKDPGSETEASPNPGPEHPGQRDPSAGRTSYRGFKGFKPGGEPPSPPPDPQAPRLYVVPTVAQGEREAIPEGTNPARRAQHAARQALAAEIRATRPEWSARSISRALDHPDVTERPWPVVADAMRRLAADPATQHPGRLRHDGPWWHQAARAAEAAPAWPPWCGNPCCTEHTRRREDPETGADAGPCPDCHPTAKARTA